MHFYFFITLLILCAFSVSCHTKAARSKLRHAKPVKATKHHSGRKNKSQNRQGLNEVDTVGSYLSQRIVCLPKIVRQSMELESFDIPPDLPLCEEDTPNLRFVDKVNKVNEARRTDVNTSKLPKRHRFLSDDTKKGVDGSETVSKLIKYLMRPSMSSMQQEQLLWGLSEPRAERIFPEPAQSFGTKSNSRPRKTWDNPRVKRSIGHLDDDGRSDADARVSRRRPTGFDTTLRRMLQRFMDFDNIRRKSLGYFSEDSIPKADHYTTIQGNIPGLRHPLFGDSRRNAHRSVPVPFNDEPSDDTSKNPDSFSDSSLDTQQDTPGKLVAESERLEPFQSDSYNLAYLPCALDPNNEEEILDGVPLMPCDKEILVSFSFYPVFPYPFKVPEEDKTPSEAESGNGDKEDSEEETTESGDPDESATPETDDNPSSDEEKEPTDEEEDKKEGDEPENNEDKDEADDNEEKEDEPEDEEEKPEEEEENKEDEPDDKGDEEDKPEDKGEEENPSDSGGGEMRQLMDRDGYQKMALNDYQNPENVPLLDLKSLLDDATLLNMKSEMGEQEEKKLSVEV